MFAIQVEYLLGRAVATDPHARDAVEWPPHPGRLFSALVDAHGAMPSPQSEAALRWLEALPAPALRVDLDADVSIRDPVKYWVPTNDEVAPKRANLAPLVDRRERRERYFPAAIPTDPTVAFVWSGDAGPHRAALVELAQSLVYLGHSSSVIAARVLDDPPIANLLPDATGSQFLRVPGPGRYDRLTGVHAERVHNTLVQAPLGREQAYAQRDRSARGPHGAAYVLVIEDGSRLSLEQTAILIPRLRAALLDRLATDIPAVLSGHLPNGNPLPAPHLALCPLANVGFARADGSIQGFAAVLPRGVDPLTRQRLRDALSLLRELRLGRLGTLQLALQGVPALKSTRFDRYCQSARTWVSVTPVALSRHAKPSRGLTAAAVVAWDLANLGLPAPCAVECSWVPMLEGAPPASVPGSAASAADGYARGNLKQLAGRQHVHVRIRFDEPVRGPILLGAGRHIGFGLLLPQGEPHAD